MANKFGGGGFGGGNMQNLMKQAQMMQQKMAEAQQQLDESVVEGESGGGRVKIGLSGKKNIVSVKIDPAIVDPADVEMLEDLVHAAFSDAAQKADDLSAELMGPFGGAGGLL